METKKQLLKEIQKAKTLEEIEYIINKYWLSFQAYKIIINTLKKAK